MLKYEQGVSDSTTLSFVVFPTSEMLYFFLRDTSIILLKCQIQFFKQGPAYKKEGPDPNKGSNQQ